MDFEEEVPFYSKNSKMPMPESYKKYIDKNNNKRVFQKPRKYILDLDPIFRNI
jgi:hypothetical protein